MKQIKIFSIIDTYLILKNASKFLTAGESTHKVGHLVDRPLRHVLEGEAADTREELGVLVPA